MEFENLLGSIFALQSVLTKTQLIIRFIPRDATSARFYFEFATKTFNFDAPLRMQRDVVVESDYRCVHIVPRATRWFTETKPVAQVPYPLTTPH